MPRELNIGEPFPCRDIDSTKRSVAESDIEPLTFRVIAHVVGIALKVKCLFGAESFCVKETACSIVAAGHSHKAVVFQKRHSLWFVQSSHIANDFVCRRPASG